MPYAAAISTKPTVREALAELEACAAKLGTAADLATVFFSPHHADEAEELAAEIADRVRANCVIGCMGESIVGPGVEVENQPAISLWLANFGGAVEVEAFHLQPTDTPDGLSLLGWPDALDECDPAHSAVLLLGDPYSFPVVVLFAKVREDWIYAKGWLATRLAGRQ